MLESKNTRGSKLGFWKGRLIYGFDDGEGVKEGMEGDKGVQRRRRQRRKIGRRKREEEGMSLL